MTERVPLFPIVKTPNSRGPRLRVMDAFVYFAFACERVKISYTTDWGLRLRHLQTACPALITPFVVIKADKQREWELHQKFDHLRTHGEWFEAAPEIHDFIRTIPDEERIR